MFAKRKGILQKIRGQGYEDQTGERTGGKTGEKRGRESGDVQGAFITRKEVLRCSRSFGGGCGIYAA